MQKNPNKLLKIIITVVMAIVFFAILSKCSHKTPPQAAKMKTSTNSNKLDNASGDTVTETIKTLTAELRKTQKNSSAVAQDNQALKKQIDYYQKTLNTFMQSQHVKSVSNSNHQAPQSNVSNANDSLAQQVANMQDKTTVQAQGNQATVKKPGQVINIVNDISGYHASRLAALQQKKNQSNSNQSTTKKPKAIPYYTIPPNATSVNTTLLTALIGRVPVNGKVDDPYPFKLIIGSKNLAANGLYLPEIAGMVATGYAVGDMDNLGTNGNKCARGYITSVTFVFNDGTISTQTSNDNDKASDSDDNSALGWISDTYGNPCIDGEFFTNAPKYLAIDMGLNAASGAASAYSNAETTTLASGDSLVTGVTGNNGKYVLGQAMANSTKDADTWVQNRMSQSFDAVIVRPTTKDGRYKQVAIHFQHEIDIDYNPTGRKIRYAHSTQNNVTRRLD